MQDLKSRLKNLNKRLQAKEEEIRLIDKDISQLKAKVVLIRVYRLLFYGSISMYFC